METLGRQVPDVTVSTVLTYIQAVQSVGSTLGNVPHVATGTVTFFSYLNHLPACGMILGLVDLLLPIS